MVRRLAVIASGSNAGHTNGRNLGFELLMGDPFWWIFLSDSAQSSRLSGSRTRLRINRWPIFGYYFAPVWGTIAPMARPGKPQFSSGRIFTERSNPSPSSSHKLIIA
jgi:hypothetical protein